MNITDFYSQSFSSNTGCVKPTIEEIAQEAAKTECQQDFVEKDPNFADSAASKISASDIEKWNNNSGAEGLKPEDIDFSYDSEKQELILTVDGNKQTISTADFLKDGMVDSAELVNGKLVITFNTDAGKSNVEVDLSELFDTTQFYTKTESDAKYATKSEIPDVSGFAVKSEVTEEINSAVSSIVIPDVSNFTTKAYVDERDSQLATNLANKQETISDLDTIRAGAALGATALQSFTETEPQFNASVASEISAEDVSNWNAKQDVLTFDNVPTAESDNPVKSSGIKTYVDEKVVEVVGNASIDFDTLGEAQEKYNELNSKYVALHNVVYGMADGEAATEMNAEYVANEIASGDRTVVIEKGELGDVTIPEVTGSTSVTAPMQDDAVVTLTTPNKSFTLTNTSDAQEPVSVTVNAPYNDNSSSNTTVYLQGEYDSITVENASIGKASDREAPVVQNITVNNNVDESVEEPKDKSASINATFTGDANNPSVVTSNVSTLTITNYNPEVDENENPITPPSLVIDAEDSTVNLNSKWNEVTATVSDDTLIINGSAHINKLTCAQKVIVKVSKASKIDEVVADYTGVNIDYVKVDVNQSNQSQMTNTAECTLVGDIEKTYGWTFGALSSDYPVWKLNGHSINITKERVGAVLLRNKACLDIYGPGTITSKDYGVWTGSENNVVNVYGGDFVCVEHALYAEKGTINVYGGTFRVTNEDKRYVLNCLDASYTANPKKAQINVYGGKFYDFDPSNSMSEPNGPVSFVAPGYHVVQGTDEVGNYYEVVAD